MKLIMNRIKTSDKHQSVTQIDARIRKIISNLNNERRPEEISLQNVLDALDHLKNARHKKVSTKGYTRLFKMLGD